MNHDISQSLPSRSIGTQDAENSRIECIANELRRSCRIHEAESGTGKTTLKLSDAEAYAAESYAKENNLWVPMERISDLGTPGMSGNENELYVSDDIIFKVNNLMNTGSITALLEKALMHNELFPETFYRLYGFTGFGGRSVYPILQQALIKEAESAPQIAIDTFMAALGFEKEERPGRYTNGKYIVWDLLPRNVLRDKDGDLYVVDAEIKRINEVM